MKKTLVVGLVAFSVVGGIAFASTSADTLLACAKRNGALYLIGDGFKREDCKRNDRVIGLSGTERKLHAIDSAGVDLGEVITVVGPNALTTYLEDVDLVLPIIGTQIGQTTTNGDIPFFDNPGCIGQFYTDDELWVENVALSSGGRLYRKSGDFNSRNVFTVAGDGACVERGERSVYEISEVPDTVIAMPSLPIRIEKR